jgi:hypothetical protein
VICIAKNWLFNDIHYWRLTKGNSLGWDQYDLGSLVLLNAFERQLHITVLVIVFDVLPPIMHGKKIQHFDALVTLFVLEIMGKKNRQFEKLAQTRGIEKEYRNGDIGE